MPAMQEGDLVSAAKGDALLMQYLSPTQRQAYRSWNGFAPQLLEEVGQHGIYLFRKMGAGFVLYWKPLGSKSYGGSHMCLSLVMPRGQSDPADRNLRWPVADRLLAMLLMLRSDEKAFLRMAPNTRLLGVQ
jgi:hypothetical protein